MITRFAEAAVRDALLDTPVVLIHGPRQSGKSTLAKVLTDSHFQGNYVTLDDPLPLELARRDPATFLSQYKSPLVIDEIQRAPELFLPLKASVDRDRQPGRYLLTGSANVLALPKVADSLAGRMEIVDLLPFAQSELESGGNWVDRLFGSELDSAEHRGSSGDFLERIVVGGFPEPSSRLAARRREAWFAAYVRSLLERDVRDLAHIDALTQLPRLLNLVAARCGETLNISSLARDTGIPATSLTRYLDLLEAVFLIQLVPAWSADQGSRFTKTPKAYLVDTGLLCYLANLDAKHIEADPSRLRSVLLNFVAMELKKLASFGEVRPFVLHLRTVRQLEVDFVLEARSGDVVGIDVKPAAGLHPRDADGLRYLQELAGDRFRRGVVLYLGDEVTPMDKDILAMPLKALWT